MGEHAEKRTVGGSPHDDDPRGDWFVTASGRRQFIGAPNVGDILIEDIAEALSKTCRFGGQCRGFYSVAQHSVFVSVIVPREYALGGLLHDAAEAYLGDVIRPLKHELARYKELERLWENAISTRFGLPCPPWARCIKHADRVALATERRDLLPYADPSQTPDSWKWVEDELGVAPADWILKPQPWESARSAFLTRFAELRSAEVSA